MNFQQYKSQHINSQHYYSQHYDSQYNYYQHNGLIDLPKFTWHNDIQHKAVLMMPGVIMLSVIRLNVVAPWGHMVQKCGAERLSKLSLHKVHK